MRIAIITLNYNGKEDTLELLESLQKLQPTSYELHTIVVDNASSDGSVSEIKKQFPEANILQTGANLGFAGGFNKGIDYAKVWGADYFLLINNDCLIKDTDLVTRLIETAKKDAKIGLVSPKIYFAPGFEFHKDRYKSSDLGKIIWYAGGKFDWDNISSIHRGLDEADSGQYDGEEETELISGACLLIKKEVLERVGPPAGGFDESYFLYFEDSDFVKRVKDIGFKTYYTGKTSIYHKVSRSTGIGSPVTDYYHTRNRLIFGMKYAKGRTKFALLRESIKLLIFGRPAQKKGVLDFYMGVHLLHPGSVQPRRIEYPLKLSIGIVNYNTADLTKKLLISIFNKNSGFDPETMEVIVLDNGLIDPCKDKIKEFSQTV